MKNRFLAKVGKKGPKGRGERFRCCKSGLESFKFRSGIICNCRLVWRFINYTAGDEQTVALGMSADPNLDGLSFKLLFR